ncbi:MAG: patatin-like protein [Acidobacteria bacterium]|nr:patatin-like protein [Acidobacteriota bacterium]
MADKSCEVRVGLVMYGGVSLAVYINGVAQEFFRAVKGHGVYKALKTLTDTDIVLDIISGSSAGGINGVLLSYALCNDRDFGQCSQLWREVADVRKLLRSPFKDEIAPKSVMDSEVYYQEGVEDAFRNMRNYSPSIDEEPSLMTELDLFVTGTDMDGKITMRPDDAGHIIEVKDHRAVFQLKFREARKNPFNIDRNPEAVVALAKLCRLTSCFPGAFAPVLVQRSTRGVTNPDEMNSDELLQYWGRLNREAYFVDGGVLDNKPFTHTIREIFYRTAEKKVDRKLYYVEPDPERFGEIQVREPNFLKPIVDSLVTIPGYESIAEDLKLLSARNTRIREFQRLFDKVQAAQKAPPQSPYATAPSVEIPAPPALNEPLRSLYERTRVAAISNRVLQAVFDQPAEEELMDDAHKNAARRLVKSFDAWEGGTGKALVDFDINYRQRRVFHVIYRIYAALYLEKTAPDPQQRIIYKVLWHVLNRHIKLYEIIASAMERIMDESDYEWPGKTAEEVWSSIRGSLEALLGDSELIPQLGRQLDANWHNTWLDQNALSLVHVKLKTRASEIIRVAPRLKPSPDFKSLLLVIDEYEHRIFTALFSDPADPIYRAYYEFAYCDAALFPIEYVSGLKEKDIIETVRISPIDAQKAFSRRKSTDKVTGESLAHFSAFFKRSWRSNDIMWGRLDAVCQLVETLFTEKRLREVLPQEHLRERMRQQFFPNSTTTLVQRLFPHAGIRTQNDLNDWIILLTSNEWQGALAVFGQMQELLIQAAQFEVLHEELPEVHFDALREQAEWDPGRQKQDSLLLTAQSDEAVRKWFADLTSGDTSYARPSESRLGRYFEKYAVGKETLLNHIPTLILLDTLSRTLLIVKNCILGMFSDTKVSRIKANRFYVWAVDIPLKAFYGVIAFLRVAPAVQVTAQAAMTALSLLAILVGVIWRRQIIETGGAFSLLWFGVFLALPTIVLCMQALFFSRTRIRDLDFKPNTKTAIIAVCTAAPLALVVAFWMGLLEAGRTVIVDTFAAMGITVRPAVVTFLMYLLYVAAPLVLPIVGGWGGVALQRRRRITRDEVVFNLECLKWFQLRDVARMLKLDPEVFNSQNRILVLDAIVKKTKDDRDWGRLKECIRKVNPDAFH